MAKKPFSGQPTQCSVNVSSRQLSDPGLADDVREALAESGLSPQCLALELTESSILGNSDQTRSTLHRLRSMGVRLEIDDFGTGYSSLSYLQQLPLGTLKIDRSFIRGLNTDNGSIDIVRAIMQLAHSLRLEVIAEGVENGEQLTRLRELGCNLIQGFFFSRPVGAEEAEHLYWKIHDSVSGSLLTVNAASCDPGLINGKVESAVTRSAR